MPVRPRYAAARRDPRPFVDREFAVEAFDEEVAQTAAARARGQGGADAGPRVLNFSGVGGIGKTRLLEELRRRVAPTHRTGVVDLAHPAMRQQDGALAELRKGLGAQGVRFGRYDIAAVTLWQRLHPHLRVDERQLPLVGESEMLGQIIDSASGVPVFGTAVGLLKLADKAAGRMRRWRTLREDPELAQIDALSNAELADAVTYFFAKDLRDAGDMPYVVFVDAHEALVGGGLRTAREATGDAWLRDLVWQLDTGASVVASREPLRWERHDADWAAHVRTVALDDLPAPARLEFLTRGGMTDPAWRAHVAHASAGVPFYLDLALDTWQSGEGLGASGTLVSPEQILERFLLHVDPHDARLLELLSAARMFDYEVFNALARAFHLPADRIAWESLSSYSFVHPVQPPFARLHQLMADALRQRLSPEVLGDAHRVLASVWDRWAAARDTADAAHRPARGGSAALGLPLIIREAVYHAAVAGGLTGERLLGYADRAVARGGTQALDGIITDVRLHLAEQALTHPPTPAASPAEADALADLGDAVHCLDVESAVRIGDAARAVALTPDPDLRLTSTARVRVAVAAAHGRRILGETGAALRLFTEVWQHPVWQGPDAARLDVAGRRVAGLWAADLDMAQGRFAEATATALDILGSCPEDDPETAGDLARLLHLSSRFSFDFADAAAYLEQAGQAYERAGSVTGRANVAVNRAELLAWTAPAEAIEAADEALAAQGDVGARHEIGKAYTAMALAYAGLGDTQRGHTALNLACEALERARYRSGRARAELVRAALHLRDARPDLALASAVWAVAEFEQVEVYPTFVLLAERLLRLGGAADARLTAAAGRARAAIHPVGTLAGLEDRMGRHLADLLETSGGGVAESGFSRAVRLPRPDAAGGGFPDPGSPARQRGGSPPTRALLDLYRAAQASEGAAAGFYNHNVRVESTAGPVNVRIPIAGADAMDLRIWPEHEVLRAIAPYIPRAPRVLAVCADPAFQVHQFIDGRLLDDIAPRGTAVPAGLPEDVVTLLAQLGAVPGALLPPLPPGWPDDGDTAGFAERLSAVTAGVWERFRGEYAELYAHLGVPEDPLAPVRGGWRRLTRRPFRLVHCDIHRKNVVIGADGHAVFLDWELALWGDPVYDVAVHLHKTAYLDAERDRLLRAWVRALPARSTASWQADVERYLTHERVKSAVVDTVRYAKLVRDPETAQTRRWALVHALTGKLNAAGRIWGWRARTDPATVARVLGVRGD